jgi:hypothetical protein
MTTPTAATTTTTTTTNTRSLTLAQILSDLGTLKACPPSLQRGILSEGGTGLSSLPLSAMTEDDDADDAADESLETNARGTQNTDAGGTQGTDAGGTLGRVSELLRMRSGVERWVRREGEGERRVREVREVEERVREVLVEMSRYMDV